VTQKMWDEMSEEEREMIWTSDLTDDERRDLGVPKFTPLDGLRIQNWASEEDETEFFLSAVAKEPRDGLGSGHWRVTERKYLVVRSPPRWIAGDGIARADRCGGR